MTKPVETWVGVRSILDPSCLKSSSWQYCSTNIATLRSNPATASTTCTATTTWKVRIFDIYIFLLHFISERHHRDKTHSISCACTNHILRQCVASMLSFWLLSNSFDRLIHTAYNSTSHILSHDELAEMSSLKLCLH